MYYTAHACPAPVVGEFTHGTNYINMQPVHTMKGCLYLANWPLKYRIPLKMNGVADREFNVFSNVSLR